MPKLEFKTAGVTSVSEMTDLGDGVITAIVSITGVEDNLGDTIVPGAYKDTLEQMTPKGVWGHDWNTPTSRTENVEELMPGDPRLPKFLNQKKQIPWPKEAGALAVTTRFNLDSTRGRDAYSDVKFFGPDQEWSIGYKVDPARTQKKGGKRSIGRLALYEYSPVLHGAMPNTRNGNPGVKDAQLAFKTLNGVEVGSYTDAYMEYKSAIGLDGITGTDPADGGSDFIGDSAPDLDIDIFGTDTADDDDTVEDIDDELDDDDEYDIDDDDEIDEEDDENEYEDDGEVDIAVALASKGLTPTILRSAIKTLEEVLTLTGEKVAAPIYDVADMATMYIEAKASGYDTASQAVNDITVHLQTDESSELDEAAEAFDTAIKNSDVPGAEKAANEITDIVHSILDANGDDSGGDIDSVRAVAQVVADSMQKLENTVNPNTPDDAGNDGSGDDGDNDGDSGDDSESKWISPRGIEYKNAFVPVRTYGTPTGRVPLEGKTRQRAFIGGLDYEDLNALDDYLSDKSGQVQLKGMVSDELRYRENVGMTETKKVKTPVPLRAKGRADSAAKNNAMPDGSFPINNEKMLKNAIMDYNRSQSRLPDAAGVLALIKRRAKELDCEDCLDSLSDTKGSGVIIETKSLASMAALLSDDDFNEPDTDSLLGVVI